ncbi:hypothetical protein ACP70R_049590 [Stipagrostis hirtigluma subsp. patula]
MELEHLATLDVRGTSVRQLPAFRSSKLVSLLADELKISMRMGEGMQGLEELSTVLLDKYESLNAVAEFVNQSKRLRVARASNVQAAEVAIRDKVRRIPNKPILELSRVSENITITDASRGKTPWDHKWLFSR